MDSRVLATIDPVTLGERLADARKARGMTQQQSAEAVGIARTTLVAMEKGDRRPRASELLTLARLYGESVGSIVRHQDRTEKPDFVIHFRSAQPGARPESESKREADIRRFDELCRWYVELEEMLDTRLPRRYPEPYDISGSDPERAAEEVAISERNRLGLGDGPVGDLWSLLEADVGLRLFAFPMKDSSLSGLFIYTDDFGGCVAINANHPEERRRLTGSHEYAHFLTDRMKPEITVFKGRSQGKKTSERFANAFSRFFLMPASGLSRRFEAIRRAKNAFTPADIVTLSHAYQVSVQSMVLRLEDLRLLPSGAWDQLTDLGFSPAKAREMLQLPPQADGLSGPSIRYSALAVQAFEKGQLTEGQLAERLGIDRVSARERVAEFTTLTQLTDDGEWKQIPLDLSADLLRMA